MENLQNFRKNYTKSQLNESEVKPEPIKQFKLWFNEAIKDDSFEANAMVLSTVNNANKPSSRIVLLKQIEDDGFVFFTNYRSKKANDLKSNNNASILFFWEKFERQIRIEGNIEKVSEKVSKNYFKSRPRASQIGAAVSNQSSILENRSILEKEILKYDNVNEISKPENWGGYILKPNYFEFWQGRANRLHDRIIYTPKDNKWDIKRLYP